MNQPDRDRPDSDQISPAVDFDGCGNIIVTWVGQSPPNSVEFLNVYARRLYFDDSTNLLYFLGDQFIVNSEDGWELESDPALIHPAVAISPSGSTPVGPAPFLIAWNARTFATDESESLIFPTHFQWGVRGQFFESSFRAVGPNFDVSPNPRPGAAATFEGVDRTLAESAQHTIDYAGKGTKVATWTETTQGIIGEDPVIQDVWVTEFDFPLVSETIEEYFDSQPGRCTKGDLNLDGIVTFDDIEPFVELLVSLEPWYLSYAELCPADVNNDGSADGADIQCFVDLLTGGASDNCSAIGNPCSAEFVPPEQSQFGFGEGAHSEGESASSSEDSSGSIEDSFAASFDCNGDGLDDWSSIESGDVADCNGNGQSDDCDQTYGFILSFDCNDNGTLDECDVARGDSADVDWNGIPDECDAAVGLSPVARSSPVDLDGQVVLCSDEWNELLDFGNSEAQTAFYEWTVGRAWGLDAMSADGAAISGVEQFRGMIEKRIELGLPLSNPYSILYRIEHRP